MKKILLTALLFGLALGACDKKDEARKGPPPTVVTVGEAKLQRIEVVESTVGQADSDSAPTIAAEVAGRVLALHVDVGQAVRAGQALAELDAQDQRIARQAAAAEVKRVEALYRNQERLVERYRKLVEENFVARTALENEEAQFAVYREQLAAAHAQLEGAERNLARTRLVSPVAGRIEQRMVSVGDFVSVGKPLFQVATARALRVHLPFPETVAPNLKTGLRARLTSPAAPGKAVEGRVSDIRPMISGESRAIDVIVDVPNPGNWRPGASVNGEVVIAAREALMVPEVSVVLRPAGDVVYLVENGSVAQRPVKTGIRQKGMVEITEGLKPGETIVVDGAPFLTDKAKVAVKRAEAEPAAAAANAPAATGRP